ncbi:hypothetical protein HDV05_008147 [Chytridiales sp. JEL 0842]|nr:hypothetical protein HDV05_008147 [Chytridiales sp. JEL 0842]
MTSNTTLTAPDCAILAQAFPSKGFSSTPGGCCIPESGIDCMLNQYVFTFVISGGDISGPVPPILAQLPFLRGLYLDNTLLSGSIPDVFQNLTRLTNLEITNSKLSGPAPSFLGQMAALRRINFLNNNFTGPVPESWGSSPTIEAINILGNQMFGSLPQSIETNSRLVFIADGNCLSEQTPGRILQSQLPSEACGNGSSMVPTGMESPGGNTTANAGSLENGTGGVNPTIVAVIIAVTFAIALSLSIGILVIRRQRAIAKNIQPSSAQNGPFSRFTLPHFRKKRDDEGPRETVPQHTLNSRAAPTRPQGPNNQPPFESDVTEELDPMPHTQPNTMRRIEPTIGRSFVGLELSPPAQLQGFGGDVEFMPRPRRMSGLSFSSLTMGILDGLEGSSQKLEILESPKGLKGDDSGAARTEGLGLLPSPLVVVGANTPTSTATPNDVEPMRAITLLSPTSTKRSSIPFDDKADLKELTLAAKRESQILNSGIPTRPTSAADFQIPTSMNRSKSPQINNYGPNDTVAAAAVLLGQEQQPYSRRYSVNPKGPSPAHTPRANSPVLINHRTSSMSLFHQFAQPPPSSSNSSSSGSRPSSMSTSPAWMTNQAATPSSDHLESKPIQAWTTADVYHYFTKSQAVHYILNNNPLATSGGAQQPPSSSSQKDATAISQIFLQHAIDGPALLQLNLGSLKSELGIEAYGTRLKIMQILQTQIWGRAVQETGGIPTMATFGAGRDSVSSSRTASFGAGVSPFQSWMGSTSPDPEARRGVGSGIWNGSLEKAELQYQGLPPPPASPRDGDEDGKSDLPAYNG